MSAHKIRIEKLLVKTKLALYLYQYASKGIIIANVVLVIQYHVKLIHIVSIHRLMDNALEIANMEEKIAIVEMMIKFVLGTLAFVQLYQDLENV